MAHAAVTAAAPRVATSVYLFSPEPLNHSLSSFHSQSLHLSLPPDAGSPVASGRSALPDVAMAVVVSGACAAFPCPRRRAMRWPRWSACGLWKVFFKKKRFLDVLWLFVGKGLYQAFNRQGRFIWATTSAPSRIGSASRFSFITICFFLVTMFTCLNEISDDEIGFLCNE